MKPVIKTLRKYQQIWAIVEEVIAKNEVVINFSGDLIRVVNQTNKNLRPGQRVLVKVEDVFPLKLKLVDQKLRAKIFAGSLDVEI